MVATRAKGQRYTLVCETWQFHFQSKGKKNANINFQRVLAQLLGMLGCQHEQIYTLKVLWVLLYRFHLNSQFHLKSIFIFGASNMV